jgi:hypothetical protein
MKIELKGFIAYRTDDYILDDKHRWHFTHYDPRNFKDPKELFVCEHSFTAEVPDNFDPRLSQVDALREEEKKLRAEFTARVTEINARIQSLLALEMS